MKEYRVSNLEISETYGGVLACETMEDVFLVVDTILILLLKRGLISAHGVITLK